MSYGFGHVEMWSLIRKKEYFKYAFFNLEKYKVQSLINLNEWKIRIGTDFNYKNIHRNSTLNPYEGVFLNQGILKKAIVILLLLTVGVFLVHAYWTEIVSVLGESLKMLAETRIRYVILAFLVYLLSVYLFAVRWQQVLSSIGHNLKATDLLPILFGAIFVNNLTPANRTGGEPLRMLWVNKRFGISYTDAFITILFERLVEAIPIILLLFYVLYFVPSLDIKFLPLKNILTLNSTYLFLLASLATGILIWIFRERFTVLLKDIKQNWKKNFINLLFLLSYYLLGSGFWI